MATNGSKSIKLTDDVELWFYWQVQETDVENNSSKISWYVQLKSGADAITLSTENKYLSVYIQGTKYEYNVSLAMPSNSSKTLCSGTHIAKHNLDGTCVANYFVTLEVNNILSGELISTEQISGTATLNRIDRRSSITCADAYVEDEAVIYINSYDSSFTHTITYSFKGETGTIATKTSDSTVYWQTPDSFWELMPTETKASCTLTCETYSGDTLVGSGFIYINMLTGAIPPTFSATFSDTSGSNWDLTGGSERSIRYVTGSNLYYNITATPARGATIADYKTVYGNKTYTGQQGYTDNSDYLTATVTVTDSRGISATKNITLDMADYFYPTITLKVTKPTTDGESELTFEGTHFNQSFGAQNNSFTLEYRFKKEGESYSSWSQVLPTRQTTTTYYSVVDKSSLDYTSAYLFQARITDSITIKESPAIRVRSTPVFDWSEDDFAFNVPVSIQGDLTLQGNLVADYVINQGTTAVSGMEWHWTKWKSGKAECYGIKQLNYIAMTADTSNTSTGTGFTPTATVFKSGVQTLTLPDGLFDSVECLHLDLAGVVTTTSDVLYPCTWVALIGDQQPAIPTSSINYCLLSTRFSGQNSTGASTLSKAYVSCYIKGTVPVSQS